MKREELRKLLESKILIFDGGTGSLLQEAGLRPGEPPEIFNITRPQEVLRLHREYLEAGCDIIKTNTFGANRIKFHEGSRYGLEEIVTAAMGHAREAVRQWGKGLIALDLGPTGKLLKPLGDLGFEETVDIYREVVQLGVREGADLILIETMSDCYELKAAVLAVREASDLPIFATVIYDEKGRLLTGASPRSVIAVLEGLGVDAVGLNCGLGPDQMLPLAEEYVTCASLPVIVNPNAGLPRSEGNKTVYDIGPAAFEKAMAPLVDLGVSVAGGCCGTTPEHIRRLSAMCRGKRPPVLTKKCRTVVTSFAASVEIDREPVVIGERINPTGKPKLKKALRESNMDVLMQEAVRQQEDGAVILDINVGMPELDEPSLMEAVVRELQGITELPLQIDTSNLTAMERAMRIYNGKPLINSVNGKKEVMEAVFPLMQRYGGVAVALTLDEAGIPETADGRIAVAKKIYETAAEYGIGKEDLLIDALCLTISSDPDSALVTLETVRRVREELGGRTILGVSNISFGLPQREAINSAFFLMALQNGLNAAIVNPGSEAMMRAYYSYRALSGLDRQCSDYIRVYGGKASGLGETIGKKKSDAVSLGPMPSDQKKLLMESVIHGWRDQAREAAEKLLEEEPPLEVINQLMIPALDLVGKGFEEGTIYLPQLLMSAEAAKAAFEVLKERLELQPAEPQAQENQEKPFTVILATVRGDIHDIGKNIVKVLLESYRFEVVDLGKDVPPQVIAAEAARRHAPLVGLSALMTTTVPGMADTIALIRESAPWARVMAGGAVLTPEYAERIGADAYCRDAMASVAYAQKLKMESL